MMLDHWKGAATIASLCVLLVTSTIGAVSYFATKDDIEVVSGSFIVFQIEDADRRGDRRTVIRLCKIWLSGGGVMLSECKRAGF